MENRNNICSGKEKNRWDMATSRPMHDRQQTCTFLHFPQAWVIQCSYSGDISLGSSLDVWSGLRFFFMSSQVKVEYKTAKSLSSDLHEKVTLADSQQHCVVKKLWFHFNLQSTLTLSLPRVINFKFLLQPHHKCYTTQYEELGFSSLTQMKDDYTINSHYLTYTFSL